MNNLYRELAPVSAAAWASIEEEAKANLHAAPGRPPGGGGLWPGGGRGVRGRNRSSE